MAPPAAERKAARERAADHLAEAARIAESLGAPFLAADIEQLQQAAGLRPQPPTTAATPAHQPGPLLTSRELEVLRLLAGGQSNGQIAVRLGISVKTAGVHVSNILRKLDASNRVEAAMRANRQGLIDVRR
jgi:DNA-binding NarL/FixJ family response regulator